MKKLLSAFYIFLIAIMCSTRASQVSDDRIISYCTSYKLPTPVENIICDYLNEDVTITNNYQFEVEEFSNDDRERRYDFSCLYRKEPDQDPISYPGRIPYFPKATYSRIPSAATKKVKTISYSYIINQASQLRAPYQKPAEPVIQPVQELPPVVAIQQEPVVQQPAVNKEQEPISIQVQQPIAEESAVLLPALSSDLSTQPVVTPEPQKQNVKRASWNKPATYIAVASIVCIGCFLWYLKNTK